ncbi:MAG: hypothetical protein OEZ01_08625 [Candidatus Heimdallarchaeota archaeon]|nr:hypothetical protein [Candidatus Heimdallarchaeota archaeon]MDH5646058.1 hypothetical protein [Candidatus Heimdallarchaeota archaeon]
MRATLSAFGSILWTVSILFILVKLYKPTKESGFSYKLFRGSLFWSYLNFGLFTAFLSVVLFTDDVVLAGLIGYVIGHVFLYISLAFFIFAPFSIFKPDDQKIPKLLSIIILISGTIISYINWIAYTSGDNTPEVANNGIMIWNPPNLVFFYIIILTISTWGIMGIGLFWYHAMNTDNKVLKKRSFLMGLGFLMLILSGPVHDVENISQTIIILVDIMAALAILFQGYAISLDPRKS